MDDNKNFSRPEPENLPHTPNADNASDTADDIDEDAQKIALLGSLTLYLDFINLFIYLLRIFGNSRDYLCG